MRIIPVIDLLNSKVVHAVAGEREKYLPLKTILTKDLTPVKLIEAFIEKLGTREVYIADLDSILNNAPNLKILEEILNKFKLQIILDPGIKTESDFHNYQDLGLYKIILGTETIQNLDVIEHSIEIFGKNGIIVSVDMKNEKILTKCRELKNLTPIQTVLMLEKMGVTEIILLDLSRVGKKVGNIPESFIYIRKNSNISIMIGGGIKNFNDILELEKNNFSGVLIATAIHQGLIPAQKIKSYITKLT